MCCDGMAAVGICSWRCSTFCQSAGLELHHADGEGSGDNAPSPLYKMLSCDQYTMTTCPTKHLRFAHNIVVRTFGNSTFLEECVLRAQTWFLSVFWGEGLVFFITGEHVCQICRPDLCAYGFNSLILRTTKRVCSNMFFVIVLGGSTWYRFKKLIPTLIRLTDPGHEEEILLSAQQALYGSLAVLAWHPAPGVFFKQGN